MTVLTRKDFEKLPKYIYLPCVYSFRGDPIDKGYLYIDECSAYLKHNNRAYEGLGEENVKGCRYSWKLYGDYNDHLGVFTTLEISKNLGEL